MRRHSVLFIDDEELIRQSFLQLVDWEGRQFDVAGVFKDGEDEEMLIALGLLLIL